MYKSGTFLFLTILCSFGECVKLPSNFPICKRDRRTLPECFSDAIEKVIKLLPIPELGLPSIEPIEFEKVTYSAGSSGNFRIDQTYSNLKIYDVVNTKINKTEIEFDDKSFNTTIYAFAPIYKLKANYELKGQILLLPIAGNGTCDINFENVKSTFKLKGTSIQKKGRRFIKLQDVDVEYALTKIFLNFDNLFNGDERLGKEMNRVLNENWEGLFEEFKDTYFQILSGFFKSCASQVFNKLTLDELFPL